MIRAGLLIGVLTVVTSLVPSLFGFDILLPCMAAFLGIAAGYLAGSFDKPPRLKFAVGRGAAAGILCGLGMGMGNALGMMIGKPSSLQSDVLNISLESNLGFQYASWIKSGLVCCWGINAIIFAVMGMLGGLFWFQISGKEGRLS